MEDNGKWIVLTWGGKSECFVGFAHMDKLTESIKASVVNFLDGDEYLGEMTIKIDIKAK